MCPGRSCWPVSLDPAFEADPEDGDARLGGEARGGLRDAAPAQSVRERRGEDRELDQLALLELRARGDDGLALSRELASLLDGGAGGFDTRCRRLDRRKDRRALRQPC